MEVWLHHPMLVKLVKLQMIKYQEEDFQILNPSIFSNTVIIKA